MAFVDWINEVPIKLRQVRAYTHSAYRLSERMKISRSSRNYH